jgi:Ca2+-binding EF-hand superfamily protein
MNTFAKNLFKDLDASKDGMVTFEEFKTIIDLLPDAPVNKKNLKSDFEKADTNMDGNISLEGFILIKISFFFLLKFEILLVFFVVFL